MKLYHGDCLEVMPTLDAESIDAIVTDPPYNLTDIGRTLQMAGSRQRGFMGKAWDSTGIAFDPATWAAALRVAKPGAYLLAFGGTRTVHRMTCAIEDAGWIIRDMLVWGYASGFPKSKASLKPAWEPIIMARKPGSLRGLNIDECRIGVEGGAPAPKNGGASVGILGDGLNGGWGQPVPGLGRWPANVILTDAIFDGNMDDVVGGGKATTGGSIATPQQGFAGKSYMAGGSGTEAFESYGDSGTYSRFFLIPKAARSEREPVLGGLPLRELRTMGDGVGEWSKHAPGAIKRQNVHPTVKPLDLMRHLVRLVTPKGGIVLDPFLGSGTTALAAEVEGFEWVGIEKEAEYIAIAKARLNGTQQGMAL